MARIRAGTKRRAIRSGPLLAGMLGLSGWPVGAPPPPRYDHVVVVIEENKDYQQIIGNKRAPFLNELVKTGVTFTRMFAEEHASEGNYFWLFAGSNMDLGFNDEPPAHTFAAANLGAQLIAKGLSFKGYAESLPAIGSRADYSPWYCAWWHRFCLYARKHVPWISFSNLPDGPTAATSSNLPFADFPSDYNKLPTVAFVVPNLEHDMHNGRSRTNIPEGDAWLRRHLGGYYRWARTHNSLLIVTFDENANRTNDAGLTDPALVSSDPVARDRRNRIPTIFAGAHLRAGSADPTPLDHVNILRTIEAMYGLPKAGAQQPYALRAGIGDDTIVTRAFAAER